MKTQFSPKPVSFPSSQPCLVEARNKKAKWTTTILKTLRNHPIFQCFGLWKHLKKVDKTDTQEKLEVVVQHLHVEKPIQVIEKPIPVIEEPIEVTQIDPNFTTNQSIEQQRAAHHLSKAYIKERLPALGAELSVVSPKQQPCPTVDEIEIQQDLNSSVFSWEITEGVENDIQKDAKIQNQLVLYGVASQFNGCESPHRYTPLPGQAVDTYKCDNTQGPNAQLQFPEAQVELLNDSANIGFNGLCHVLDEKTKAIVKHGYLTPKTEQEAEALIELLRKNGHKVEYLCIGNIPTNPENSNTEKVYEILVSAPAFGGYRLGLIPEHQQKEVEFLCALLAYRAQFKQAVRLAKANPEKQVIFKPTAVGLGVYGNHVDCISQAFYAAAKEYESLLDNNHVRVQFQVFRGKGDAREMVNQLNLKQIDSEI